MMDMTARAIHAALISANENDANGEAANVADGLFFIGRALLRVAGAIDHVALAIEQQPHECFPRSGVT